MRFRPLKKEIPIAVTGAVKISARTVLFFFFFLNYTKDCYICFSKVKLQMEEPFFAYLHKT